MKHQFPARFLRSAFLAAFMAVSLAWLTLPRGATAASATAVSLSPSSQVVVAGGEFTSSVVVAPGTAIAGMQFDLTFDPSLVTVSKVEEGGLFSQGGASTFFNPGTIDNQAGSVSGSFGAITSPGQTVSAQGTFATITLTGNARTGDGTLDLLNVVASDENGDAVAVTMVDATVTIDGSDSHPAVPGLLSPANGASTGDRTPYLDWSKVTASSTVHYQIQVDNNADFSSPVVSKTWVSYSYYTVTTSLSFSTYYWRVRSVDADGNLSAWTAPWSFRVAVAVPALVSPAAGAVVTDHTPYLDWSKVSASSTVHYRLQVDNDADFSSPVASKTWISYSYYTVAASLSHGKYYWRVRAVDASGNMSAWTAPRSFTVA